MNGVHHEHVPEPVGHSIDRAKNRDAVNRRPYVGEHHSGTGGRVLSESWLVIGKRVLQIMEIDKSGIREGEVPAGADDTPITIPSTVS